ncbi:hypothetical protein BDW22DRAFT_42518 [Trametopsis cervina]|nr:hypothetical protein BDW22DRAFT_42518 [Trametopsis cervina]
MLPSSCRVLQWVAMYQASAVSGTVMQVALFLRSIPAGKRGEETRQGYLLYCVAQRHQGQVGKRNVRVQGSTSENHPAASHAILPRDGQSTERRDNQYNCIMYSEIMQKAQ